MAKHVYSILNMSSVRPASGAAADPDRTARARIRDAAVNLFGRDGFGASVRAIATEAGVSPGLVLHHFGSKDSLRAVCDEHVLEEIRRMKLEAVADAPPTALLNTMVELDEYVPLVAYVVRSLQAGGPLARDFIEQMIVDAQDYMHAGEIAGNIKPSRDAAARARYVVLANTGATVVLAMEQTADGSALDARKLMYDATAAATLPALEMYTEGLLTSGEMLESYLLYLSDPPGESGSDDAA